MRQQILNLYAMTLADAERLTADVPCERFAELPFTDAKHPSWVLAHLAIGSGMMVGFLSGKDGEFGCVPEAWAGVAKPGSPSYSDRGQFAGKDELLSTLREVHQQLAGAFENASDEDLAREFPNPDYRSFFPTIGDAAAYLMAHHEGYHLGQLSQWRRAAGFGASSIG